MTKTPVWVVLPIVKQLLNSEEIRAKSRQMEDGIEPVIHARGWLNYD